MMPLRREISVVPIALQRRIELRSSADVEFAVLLEAEEGFHPQADLDPAGLRFGAPSAADFGRFDSGTDWAAEGHLAGPGCPALGTRSRITLP